MPCLFSSARSAEPPVVHSPKLARGDHSRAVLMEVAALQHLSNSFSNGRVNCGGAQSPSFERLAGADLGQSFGSSRSFIDMDPAELFSMRWTPKTAAAPASDSDFDFVLAGGVEDFPSPMFVSASRIFRGGRLLPSEPGGCSLIQEDVVVDDSVRRAVDVPSAPRSTASLSSCSSAMSSARRRGAGRRGSSPPWKVLLRYLRFLVPLYRKVKALRLFAPRSRVLPASPARASTSSFSSSLEWCHGNADTAVHDAILYCKKSSGQDAFPMMEMNCSS